MNSNSDIFININKEDYKKIVGIQPSDENYYKVAFINDGSGIITRGQLYVNSSYWIKFVDINNLPSPEKQEENTIYMVTD